MIIITELKTKPRILNKGHQYQSITTNTLHSVVQLWLIPMQLFTEEWRLLGCYAFLRSVRRFVVTASVVPISPILVTLMNKSLSSSETSVPTRTTRRNIPEDPILHSYRRENLKSYISLCSSVMSDHHSVIYCGRKRWLHISEMLRGKHVEVRWETQAGSDTA
jgi:hypothetical protein